MAPKHKCEMGERFVEIEGKAKGNHELTLQNMSRIEEKVDDLKTCQQDFIKKIEDNYVTTKDLAVHSTRIDKIEKILGKINRLIIAAFITGLLALIIKMK